MAYAKIRPRRGTEYEWASYNPILAEGELAIQFPDTGIGTGLCKFKVGNGVDSWNNLPYAFDGTAAAAIDGGSISTTSLIQIRSATANAWFNANPILSEREIAYDSTNNAIKIGDGSTRWNALPYIMSAGLLDDDDNFDFGTEDSDEAFSSNDEDTSTDESTDDSSTDEESSSTDDSTEESTDESSSSEDSTDTEETTEESTEEETT